MLASDLRRYFTYKKGCSIVYSRTPTSDDTGVGTGVGSPVVIVTMVGSSVVGRGVGGFVGSAVAVKVGRLVGLKDIGGIEGEGVGGSVSWIK
jgi:hypothetical protein